MLFARLLRPFITLGTLRIVDAGGLVHTIRGHDPGPDVTIRLAATGALSENCCGAQRWQWVKPTWTAA